MASGQKRKSPICSSPSPKRQKFDGLSDDGTLSTTSSNNDNMSSTCASSSSSSSLNALNNNNNKNIIDLGVEYPSLHNIINNNTTDNKELQLDPTFNINNINNNNTNIPMIFDWKNLSNAMTPQSLRTEALRKQERGKYVRRDSLSSEQAADRRRRQNRESARRTRDRVRKYITVLEMYYKHVQNVNTLLVKQLEIMAKHCSGQLTDTQRSKLKMHEWPKAPTIEQCMDAKPATISATAYKNPIKKNNDAFVNNANKHQINIMNSQQISHQKDIIQASYSYNNQFKNEIQANIVKLPLLPNITKNNNNINNINNNNKFNMKQTINLVNIPSISTSNIPSNINCNNNYSLNQNHNNNVIQLMALQPFAKELATAGALNYNQAAQLLVCNNPNVLAIRTTTQTPITCNNFNPINNNMVAFTSTNNLNNLNYQQILPMTNHNMNRNNNILLNIPYK